MNNDAIIMHTFKVKLITAILYEQHQWIVANQDGLYLLSNKDVLQQNNQLKDILFLYQYIDNIAVQTKSMCIHILNTKEINVILHTYIIKIFPFCKIVITNHWINYFDQEQSSLISVNYYTQESKVFPYPQSTYTTVINMHENQDNILENIITLCFEGGEIDILQEGKKIRSHNLKCFIFDCVTDCRDLLLYVATDQQQVWILSNNKSQVFKLQQNPTSLIFLREFNNELVIISKKQLIFMKKGCRFNFNQICNYSFIQKSIFICDQSVAEINLNILFDI